MARSLGTMTVAVMLGLLAGGAVWAQGRGGMGGMGMQSQSAFGTGGMGSRFGGGMGSSAFGGFGGGGFGGGGMGSSFGNAGFGATQFGGGGFGNAGFGATAFGSSGMGGGMYGGGMGGQNFVGRDSGDMNAVMNQMGRAGTQFFNQMSQGMRNRGNRNRNTQPAQVEENVRPPVRIRLEMGFTPRPNPPSAVAANVRARLVRLAADHSLGNPQVTMEGGTVVLRGTAETESQRQVIGQLIAMEPGVLGVRNEMIVVSQPTAEVLPVAAE